MTVGFVGQLTESKGADRFARAVGALAAEGLDVEALAIGPGPLLDDLAGLAAPAPLEALWVPIAEGRRLERELLAAEPSRSAAFRAFDLARAAGLPLIFDVDYRPYSWPSAQVAAEVCTVRMRGR